MAPWGPPKCHLLPPRCAVAIPVVILFVVRVVLVVVVVVVATADCGGRGLGRQGEKRGGLCLGLSKVFVRY